MPSPWFNDENATPRQSIPTSRVQRDTPVSRQVPWRNSLASNDTSEDRLLNYMPFLHRPSGTTTTGEVTQPGEYFPASYHRPLSNCGKQIPTGIVPPLTLTITHHIPHPPVLVVVVAAARITHCRRVSLTPPNTTPLPWKLARVGGGAFLLVQSQATVPCMSTTRILHPMQASAFLVTDRRRIAPLYSCGISSADMSPQHPLASLMIRMYDGRQKSINLCNRQKSGILWPPMRTYSARTNPQRCPSQVMRLPSSRLVRLHRHPKLYPSVVRTPLVLNA
jgi:hypothetical protein